MDLQPGSEPARLTRAACTLITHLYPMGYAHFDLHSESLAESRCIETSRALMETLKHFGIPARLMPVDIIVNNPRAFEMKQRNVPITHWPNDAWSVGVLREGPAFSKNGGWNGHMLVRVAREWLCDPNAGQFLRPDKILLPSGWTVRYPEDWEGDEWAIVGIVSALTPTPEHPNFPILQLRHRPDNLAWRNGTAATVDVSTIVNVATSILKRLKAGTLPERVAIGQQGLGEDEAAEVDLSSIINRYQEEAS